jgi:Putative Ig domain
MCSALSAPCSADSEVFTDLTQDLNVIQGSIQQVATGVQHVQASLNDLFKAMEKGFSDIDFANHQVLAGLTSVEFTLGQLQYQTDLTDGDVVAFGEGEVQTQIQGTINQCLDRTARNLAPLDFSEFSDCASQFKTEAQTSASNDVVEFTTSPPSAPGNGDFSSDGTVATTLAAHGMDPAKDLSYLLGILHGWYGLGTDPSTLTPSLANPGVWSEVALGYRELLDEYPQFSAGPEPDLGSIEAPGQQVASLISALQQVDPATGANAAVEQLGSNYRDAFKRLIADINQHQENFGTLAGGPAYSTPSGQSWSGFVPVDGIDQPLPQGADPAQQLTTIPRCGTPTGNPLDTLTFTTPQSWESGVQLPVAWDILYRLVGYKDASLTPSSEPICNNYTMTQISNPGCTVNPPNTGQCPTFTLSGSLDVRFEGTDGNLHTIHEIQMPTSTLVCHVNPDPSACTESATAYFDHIFLLHGGLGSNSQTLATTLSTFGGDTQPATTDELNPEATQILSAGITEVYKWDVSGLTDPATPDHATLAADAANLTGAFELIQLAAQTLVPSASLGNQALSDILYGQDQLPTSLSGPNNPLPIFQALEAGTGTTTLAQYSDAQLGRLAQLTTLLDAALAAQQAAGPAVRAAARPSAGRAPATTATAEAPALTYGVLAQLATGALLDTDTVKISSPGPLTTRLGKAVSRQLTATSNAGAKITSWQAAGLPPGLSINAGTGKITGKPSKTGTYKVTVKATDTIGSGVHDSAQVTFTWKITK